MANQKEIRVKIKSVQKTKKITSAMKLVAAAKVQKVQKRVIAARPYAEKLQETFARLKTAAAQDLDFSKFPLLKNHAEVKKVLLLVTSSDRGLCGAYNTNVIKRTVKRINELKAEGKEVELVTVGSKATSYFKKSTATKLVESFCHLSAVPTVEEAKTIAEFVAKHFTEGNADRVETVSTKFISMVNSSVENKTFLPVQVEEATNGAGEEQASSNDQMLFEPDIDSLLEFLVPMYIENVVYHNLLEATASELAARMTAMSNATTNATNYINKLVVAANKARQAAITQEISEIVGGAAALG